MADTKSAVFTATILDDLLGPDGLGEIPSMARRELRAFLTRNQESLLALPVELIQGYVDRFVRGDGFAEVQYELLKTFSDRELMDFYELTTDKMRKLKNKHFRLAAIVKDLGTMLTQIGLEALQELLGTLGSLVAPKAP